MKAKKKETRGRKPLPAKDKKVQISFYVAAKHRAAAIRDANVIKNKYSYQDGVRVLV